VPAKRLVPVSAALFLLALTCTVSSRALAQAPVLLTSWPTTDIPIGMAVGPNGLVYVGAQSGGSALARIYTQGGVETGSVGTFSPETYGIGFLHSGDLLILEYYSRTMDLFTSGGAPNGSWAFPGVRALYLAVDDQDNVYMTDDNGDYVRKANSSGTLVAGWATPHPSGVACMNGLVYVAGMWNGLISIFASDGTPVGSFPTGCSWAEQLTPDGSGNLLLADYGLSQLKCFRPDGTLLWTLGPSVPGYAPGTCQFFSVVPGAGGTTLAGDFANRRILVLGQQPTPSTLTSWGSVKASYR